MNRKELESQLAGLEQGGTSDDELKGRDDDFARGEYLHEKWASQCWEAFQHSKPTPDPPKALREFWKSPRFRNKPFNPAIRPE